MPDSLTDAIDRVFDLVDNGVEKIDHVLNRGKQTEELHEARRPKRQVVIDTSASVKVKKKAAEPASSSATPATTALVPRSTFQVVETTDAVSGKTIFVVTNGKARAECTTRELAEKIMRALEAAA